MPWGSSFQGYFSCFVNYELTIFFIMMQMLLEINIKALIQFLSLFSYFFYLQENFIMTNLAAALENAGIGSFRFDFTGNG